LFALLFVCSPGAAVQAAGGKEMAVAVTAPWTNCVQVTMELDYIIYPEGSVLIGMGNTHVLCNATVEETLPRWLAVRGRNRGG
jgi:ribonuclease PH